ncbi:MAG: DUF5664 domain-containing protein [Sulfuritalea sp.]|jgi:hypothetical protein|nr:DUF5664 domain-containing protein [Sulfuritalea sp.]
MSEQAQRHNTGKPELSLLPPVAFEETARVMAYGAKKYSRDNWRKGGPVSQYIDCAYRHLNRIAEGEDVDAESGCSHAGHVMANMAFLLELKRTGKLKDDRYSAKPQQQEPPESGDTAKVGDTVRVVTPHGNDYTRGFTQGVEFVVRSREKAYANGWILRANPEGYGIFGKDCVVIKRG